MTITETTARARFALCCVSITGGGPWSFSRCSCWIWSIVTLALFRSRCALRRSWLLHLPWWTLSSSSTLRWRTAAPRTSSQRWRGRPSVSVAAAPATELTKAEAPEALATLAGARGTAKEPPRVRQDHHEAAGAASKRRGVFCAISALAGDFWLARSHKIQTGQLPFFGPECVAILPWLLPSREAKCKESIDSCGCSGRGSSSRFSATGCGRGRPSSGDFSNRLRFLLSGGQSLSRLSACRRRHPSTLFAAPTGRSSARPGLRPQSDVAGRATHWGAP